MSNIYIQEPPSSGKVVMKTSVGDIDIELWTKETPKASRNFIQLCIEGYYSNTIFHRVVKDFIVQGGDPTGTGEGGESIYGHPFKDEFHTRLRFCRRGLVAMANAGKDDNGSQFFFTLGSTPELQNKHTIFGKVTGDTVYNMLKLGEALVDENERPLYPQKILKIEVLNNPFDDIVPRKHPDLKDEVKENKKKHKAAAVKNFKLLSFGEEAEEDEEETLQINKQFVGKGKSAHDTLSDPKLSSQPAIDLSHLSDKNLDEDENKEMKSVEELAAFEQEKREMADRIRNKLLNSKKVSEATSLSIEQSKKEDNNDDNEVDANYYLGQSRIEERKRKAEQIRKEIRNLKRGVQNEKKIKENELKQKEEKKQRSEKKSEYLKEYLETQEKYKEVSAKLPKKGTSREDFTAQLLKKFKSKLQCAKEQQHVEKDTETKEETKESATNDVNDDSWMTHELHFEDKTPVLAKDASTKADDWFEIYDPRNPLNKRRRGESTKSKSSKKF